MAGNGDGIGIGIADAVARYARPYYCVSSVYSAHHTQFTNITVNQSDCYAVCAGAQVA